MSGNWTISVNETARAQWDKLLANAPAPYQQDWAYGEAMVRGGAKVMRFALHAPSGQICGLAQCVVRRFAFIVQFALCSYGPVWLKPMSPSEKTMALLALRRGFKLNWPRLVAITPDETLSPKGFRRIMTGDATLRLDLTQDEAALRSGLDGKWRNRLVAAEKSDLRFTSSNARPGQYEWLLEAERQQRKKKGYRGLTVGLIQAWQEEKARAKNAGKRDGVLIYRADLNKDPAAAMLFLTHGPMATYHIGWSSDAGRNLSAHNLVLWKAMLALKEKGFQRLDLGGVNTGSGAGIARFKLGTGAKLISRSGVLV